MNLINAKIVADSINQQGDRITTLEVVFPRYILAELNTHRMFSRNSASSRAIPFKKMVKSVQETPFIPMAWQKDHSGMQGMEYFEDYMHIHAAEAGWLRARDKAVYEANLLNANVGITKQLANRLLEPFMYHKVLVTFTESSNFFNLRSPRYETEYGVFFSWKDLCNAERDVNPGKMVYTYNYDDADLTKLMVNKGMGEIHIMDLAEKMWNAMNESIPKFLQPGEWHIPYGDQIEFENVFPFDGEQNRVNNENRLKIATARCARLSYQTLGDNPVIDYAADIKLFQILFDSGHLSPFEHIGKAMTEEEYKDCTKSYYDSDGDMMISEGWSNNFRGFLQYRALLEVN